MSKFFNKLNEDQLSKVLSRRTKLDILIGSKPGQVSVKYLQNMLSVVVLSEMLVDSSPVIKILQPKIGESDDPIKIISKMHKYYLKLFSETEFFLSSNNLDPRLWEIVLIFNDPENHLQILKDINDDLSKLSSEKQTIFLNVIISEFLEKRILKKDYTHAQIIELTLFLLNLMEKVPSKTNNVNIKILEKKVSQLKPEIFYYEEYGWIFENSYLKMKAAKDGLRNLSLETLKNIYDISETIE